MKNMIIKLAFILMACTLVYASKLHADSFNRPAGTFKTLDGKSLHIADVARGKVTLIEFSALFCGECDKIAPYLNKLNKSFEKKGFVLISIFSREKVKRLLAYKKKKRINYKIVLDSSGRILRNYRIYKYPTLKLFDRSGKLIYESLVPNKKKLRKLIAERM